MGELYSLFFENFLGFIVARPRFLNKCRKVLVGGFLDGCGIFFRQLFHSLAVHKKGPVGVTEGGVIDIPSLSKPLEDNRAIQ